MNVEELIIRLSILDPLTDVVTEGDDGFFQEPAIIERPGMYIID